MNKPPDDYINERQREINRDLARAIQEERDASWKRFNDQMTFVALGTTFYLVAMILALPLLALAIYMFFQAPIHFFLLFVVVFTFYIFVRDQKRR